MTSTGHEPDVASGPCCGCGQTRPLWRYRPRHAAHLDERARDGCRWCARTDASQLQDLLCVRCWSAEAEQEAQTPLTPGEAEILWLIASAGARHTVTTVSRPVPCPAGPLARR
jgi:hypothetical protein